MRVERTVRNRRVGRGGEEVRGERSRGGAREG